MGGIVEHSSYEWQHSRNPDIQATFRPLSRIVNLINSTPSYQIFLAGFQIAESIGFFDLNQIAEPAMEDSYRYLVGNLSWTSGIFPVTSSVCDITQKMLVVKFLVEFSRGFQLFEVLRKTVALVHLDHSVVQIRELFINQNNIPYRTLAKGSNHHLGQYAGLNHWCL
ncbi:hypothetical protein [Gimesia maris]|uniref:hypothetical protein n=1 Tax=Gimesia maris TaxID=122 RepID=UPI0018D928B9|nr:hypothetical protein [Gimesia maris]